LREIGNQHLDLNNIQKALDFYQECINKNQEKIFTDNTNLLIGYSYASQKKWIESLTTFQSVSISSPFYAFSNNCVEIINKRLKLNYKKPGLAGILSVIPGLGYIYSGHSQTAISSLMVNSLLAYATVSNINNKNYGMASLTGLFSFSFYIGNITGSVKSAKRYNNNLDINTLNKLKLNIYY
jgi:hypothetical protein